MKTIIELNKEDVETILAEYFKVPKNKVMIYISIGWEGYGPGEHQVGRLKAEVEKE